MAAKLLTIAIPTFNRSKYLDILLNSIYLQINIKIYSLDIIVLDNNSNDDTGVVVESYRNKGLELRYIKNTKNIGADRNVAKAFFESNSEYVWIVGDDDILLPNSIENIFKLITKIHPSLIYINCDVFRGEYQISNNINEEIGYVSLPRLDFLKKTNIYLTFISAVVINKEAVCRENPHLFEDIEDLYGTSLPQLGWVLPSLRSNLPCIYVLTKLVAARNENRGGFGPFDVFVKNFNTIVTKYYNELPRWISIITTAAIRRHYCELVMNMTGINDCEKEDPRKILYESCGRNPYYWIFLYPLLKLEGKLQIYCYNLIRVANLSSRVLFKIKVTFLKKNL